MGTRDCKHICGESSPSFGEAGKTGDWRTSSNCPQIDNKKCTAARLNKHVCFLCWLYCPEAAIEKTVPPKINLDYCKGCGVCAEECPAKAISMV